MDIMERNRTNGAVQPDLISSPLSVCSRSWMLFWWSWCCWVNLRSASRASRCMATSISLSTTSCSPA